MVRTFSGTAPCMLWWWWGIPPGLIWPDCCEMDLDDLLFGNLGSFGLNGMRWAGDGWRKALEEAAEEWHSVHSGWSNLTAKGFNKGPF